MPKLKAIHREGYFLRLYGPTHARTRAVLVRGHEPRPDTPEGFLAELDNEDAYERQSKMSGSPLIWKPGLGLGTRVSLPSYGATTRRILDVTKFLSPSWPVSHPPLRCAGLRQFQTKFAAWGAGTALGQGSHFCKHCLHFHLNGRGHPRSK